jgi:hypothetical protein
MGLEAGGWITRDAMVVLEHGVDETPTLAGFIEHEARTYGAALLRFLTPASPGRAEA